MSDFESRLAEALTSGAEDAPVVHRLADGARGRARARRRARLAGVAGAVALAVGIPMGVVALTDDGEPTRAGDSVTDDPPQPVPDGWHTIDNEGVVVDVPGGWARLDSSGCEFGFARVGPAGSDPCTFDHEGLAFYASATFDPVNGAGQLTKDGDVWSAYVYAGDWAVYVQAPSTHEARRILGSARTADQDAPDLTAGFRTVTDNGLSIDVPADWQEGGITAWCTDENVPGWVTFTDTMSVQIGCTPHKGYGISFATDEDEDDWIRERSAPNYPDGSWAGLAVVPDTNGEPVGFVQVIAPTQGLAELIGGSLRLDK